MTASWLTLPPDGIIPLDEGRGHKRVAHVIDRDAVVAVNAALATGRPLLVRGDPGTGKSQLARAAARQLGRAFVHHTVDARTETRDLLYTVDAVARLADAQVMGARGGTANDHLAIDRYVQPGVLWWAFEWETAHAQATRTNARVYEAPAGWSAAHGVVVLLDEIDKADSAIPNGLLDALGHGRFDAPGRDPVVMREAARPLVVVTTNEERTLPDAFLRRCFVLHLDLPDAKGEAAVREALQVRGRAQFPERERAPEELLALAAELITKRRVEMKRDRLPAPGVAEYIDLVDAVLEQRGDSVDPFALMKEVATFVLHKHAPPPPKKEEPKA